MIRYIPAEPGRKLATDSLCMTAQQYLGNQYDLRNMYSIYEAKVVKE